MPPINVDEITNALADTRVSQSGVSFAGCELKLDTAQNAQIIVDAINKCEKLEYLNLEGNTLGVEASKVIAQALEKHPELKRALWKDLFTGRLKSEIPLVLEHLGNALVSAGTRLTELDLSDNAFGPIGVEGLAALLRSSSCYNLQELRLNNNGLGIGGGKLLSKALLDCYNNSKAYGSPLALKVFIAGRNRLENEGAKALAEVFTTIGSLEEIAMPQNGIYHVGITALAQSFESNPNLQILNLNDNTIGPKGSSALANALPVLQNLRSINFGDCLIKTSGALHLAGALESGHILLEDLTLGYNTIREVGGLALARAMQNKKKLKSLILDGNQFGAGGRAKLESCLRSIGQFDKLGELNEDESDESDVDNEEGSEKSNESETEEQSISENTSYEQVLSESDVELTTGNVLYYITNPTPEAFLALGENKEKLLLNEAQKNVNKNPDEYLTNYVSVLMKVSGLTKCEQKDVADTALSVSDLLYKELFSWVHHSQQFSLLNNTLLVYLGLIKSEDKKFKTSWDLDSCMVALENVISKNYFLKSTRDTLKMFMNRVNLDDASVSISYKKLHLTLHSL